MNTILIEVHYKKFGCKVYQKGMFQVNSRLYEKFPDLEAAKAASKWVKELKYENNFDIEIKQVLYEKKDITHLVLTRQTSVPEEDGLPL